jgi:hypothetical protein
MNRVVVPAHQATQRGGIGSLESVLGLLKSLKIRAKAFLLLSELAPPSALHALPSAKKPVWQPPFPLSSFLSLAGRDFAYIS